MFAGIKKFVKVLGGNSNFAFNSSRKTMNLAELDIFSAKNILETSNATFAPEILEIHKKAKQITNIKFNKSKTMDEARLYAKEKLGIEKFEVPDLETANQINYSLTKGFNFTNGKIKGFDEVEYAALDKLFPNYDTEYAKALTLRFGKNYEKTKLIINKTYYENLDNIIEERLADYIKHGQIIEDKNRIKSIRLISDYKYINTLNRYYRLYQEGKLTPKAKFDFDSLLYSAQGEDGYILMQRTSICDFVKQQTGFDISMLPAGEYIREATKRILELGKTLSVREKPLRTNSAVGLDSSVLHELGHSDCHKRALFINPSQIKTLDDREYYIAREISRYAPTNNDEFLQEAFAAIVSGDELSTPALNMYRQNGGIYV